MKTPEEIKKGLECCSVPDYIDHLCEQCPYVYDGCYKQMLQADALAYIQQLEAKVPRWISVEKKKPRVGEFVLFKYAKGAKDPTLHARNTMAVGRYEYGMFLVNGCEVKVTHWMPLPSTEGLNDN